MTNKRYFILAGILALVGLAGISCSAPDITDTSATSIASPATEINIAPSITLSPTPLPTLSFVIPGTQYPTATPYPTASLVKANTVAFIELVGIDYSLWVANVDGSGEKKLAEIENSNSRSSNYLLQWSPDGKWISYISGDDLWIISPDGLTKRKLLSFSDENAGKLYTYVWSPDSSKVAYETIVSYEQIATPTPGPESGKIPVNIGIIDLVTGKTLILSSHYSNIFMPLLWSPNGQYLLFMRDFSFIIFELADRSVIQEIEKSCGARRNISWSPDNRWFYHIDHGTGYYNMWICVSGLNGRSWLVEDVGAVISPPVWDIAGKYLYFVVGEMNLDIGPNWCENQRLVRYDVETHKIQTLFSLKEDGPTGFPWFLHISPNGRMLGLYSYTYNEDKSRPGHIYIDSSRPKQNKFIVLDIQSMSTTKFTLEFQGEINGQFPPPTWSPDNQKIIFFLRNLVRQSYGISYGNSGSFYSLDIKTGKVELFSGVHAVENAIISPIAISP